MLTQKDTNPFKYSDDNKRYHTLYYHYRHTFGKRMMKASVNAGFSCPNIDGTAGFGGCTYCTSGASEFTLGSEYSVSEQLENECNRIFAKYKNCGIIAYFQSHTNTYSRLSELVRIYDEALSFPMSEGISISTRPDCIDEEKSDYLKKLSEKTYLTVELGLQTVFDKTADKINRCHTYKDFLKAYKMLKERNIRVCIHLINGLPDETEDMMVESAEVLGKLRPDGIKLHLLHIMKGTKMEKDYLLGKVCAMKKEEYIKTVCRQLTVLPPETVIERITGDGSKQNLVAPMWSTDKIAVLGGIDKYLYDNNLYQGMYFRV